MAFGLINAKPQTPNVWLKADGNLLDSAGTNNATAVATPYHWVQVTGQAPFAPRDGAGALVFQQKMWLLGGWNPGDKEHFPLICNNEVWSSGDGLAWQLVKTNSFLNATFDAAKDWEGRHTAGYVVYRDKMWIIGGDPIQGHYQSDVWNSTDGKTWSHVNSEQPVPWGPRVLHHTLVFNDKIWVMGGQTLPPFAPADEIFYRDIWNTDDGVHWEKIVPREPYWSARGLIGGNAVFKGRIWILGGGTYNTPLVPQRKFYNDVWSSADGIDWTCHLESAPWSPREYHDVAVFDDRLWVLEGYYENGGNRKDVWSSSDGVHWEELPATPWKPRHAASVFVHDNALWVVAGNNLESDVWKLVRNPAVVSYFTGKSGQSLLAPKGAVQIPNDPGFNTSNITVQAWVQGVAPAPYQYIVSKAREGRASYALYTGNNGGASLLLSTGSTNFITSPSVQGPAIWDGAWHQLTGLYDGTAARLYVDGLEVGSGTVTNVDISYSTNLVNGNIIVGNNPTFLGELGVDSYIYDPAFSGLIDDLKIYDHALFPSEVLASFNSGNLVGWWQAESNANDDVLGIDNGSLSGSVSYSAGRLVGKAFHTTAGAVVIANSVTLQPTNVTVEAVLRASPPGANKYIISKSFNSTSASYALYSGSGGGLAFYVSLNGGVVVSPAINSSSIWDGNDHAVAGTYDGQAVRLYVDGVQVGNGTPGTGSIQYGASQSSGALLFGDFADTLTASNFNGVIDEVKLYNTGLSAQSVLADAFHPIIITSQPTGQSVVQGGNATFSVAQLGKTPLVFQWQINGINITGATGSTLTVTNAQAANAGQYSVTIASGGVKFTTNTPFGSGQAFQLAQGAVIVPNAPSLQPPSLSLQGWVRNAGSLSRFRYIISKSQGAGVSAYAFDTGSYGGLEFYIAVSGNPGYIEAPKIASSNIWDGAWHQITGTFTDGGALHLYLDGQEVGSGVNTFASILYSPGTYSGDLLFGAFSPTPSPSYDYPGDLDEIKLFDHELSASDVLDTYNNPGGTTATNGLISWWKADGNALDALGLNPGILPPPGFVQSSQATLTVLLLPAVLTNATVVSGSFHATVTGSSSANYIVQKSTDLITWTPIVTNAIPFTFSDPVNTNQKQFYRALTQ